MSEAGGTPGSRAAILGRVRRAIGEPTVEAESDYRQIAREYRQEGGLAGDERIGLFSDRLQHYDVGVVRCRLDTLARVVAETTQGRGRKGLLVPPGIPQEWLRPDLEWVRDAALSYAELDTSPGVLTGCSIAIALTGTIVLCHTPAEGRRALTLVPDYHLCVVRADQIVHTVPEALRLLARWRSMLVTTISGPSATADIEMTRIRGVHGPRTLDVIVAG